jgi:Cu/Ag efflux pump CusA
MLVHRFKSAGDLPHARDEIDRVATETGDSALPVVATAVATALAILPFVFLGNVSGTEILRPLGVVILCGLVTSTLLTLLVLPAVYGRWGVQRTRHTDTEGAQ